MKALLVLALSFLLGSAPQSISDIPVSNKLHGISSGPGVDASVSMCISWACDTSFKHTCVRITTVSDADWTEARDIKPEEKERVEAFKGIYSKAPDGTNIHEDAVFTKCGVMVTGLKPDTDYKYVILEKEDGQAVARSTEHCFRTAGAASWSACIISDFHSYPPIPTRLTAAMGMIDTLQRIDPSIDWVLSPGDVVAWGGSYSFWRQMFEEENFHELLWARVNGNHDNWTRQSQNSPDFGVPNPFFTGTSFYPRNGYERGEGVCYHFRYGNTLFVMLNTEDMSTQETFTAAADWLRDCVTFARGSENPPTFVVVCQHYEWFNGTNGRAVQYNRWHRIFDELDIDLAIAGNNHIYVRSFPIYDGQVTDGSRGTVYLQTSACDDDRGRNFDDSPLQNPDKLAFRWTEGSHTVSAILLAVDDSRMALTLYDRHGNAVDSTVVPAKPRTEAQDSHLAYGPWVTDMSEDAFTVLWTTDVPCQGWVELDNGRRIYEYYAGRKLFGTLHTVRVKGLSRGASYGYRVGNRVVDALNPRRPAYGRDMYSARHQVTTFDPNRKTCHFSVMNDVHMRLDHYAALLDGVKIADNDFLLLNGDIISAGNWPLDSLYKYEVGPLGDCGANLPVVFSRGNHEGRGSGVTLVEKVFPKENSAPYYYTFREGPVAFIVLDAGETGVKNSLALTGDRIYEEYLREQLAWAEEAMKAPAFRKAPVKICILHAPMVDFGDPDDFVPHQWMNRQFMPVLQKAGINLMIGADLHEHFFIPAGTMNNAFPILINDDESRLDVQVWKDRIEATIYDEAGKITVPTYTIPVK
jgi:hypothetical protein